MLLMLITTECLAQSTYMPPDGYVPDDATAIKIAKAVLVPVYGEDQIVSQEPLIATLREGIWFVRGTFKASGAGSVGGVAEIEISKRDGTILRMIHGK